MTMSCLLLLLGHGENSIFEIDLELRLAYPQLNTRPVVKDVRDEQQIDKTRHDLSDLILRFDASHECQNVTCLYNSTNWWIQDLIDHPEKLETISAVPSRNDYFL